MFKLLLGILIALSINSVYAWNAAGHEIVAQIAYDHLTPAVRKKINVMVRDFSEEYPSINSFAEMAPWPDTLHAQNIEIYNHWHYIDESFSDDKTRLKNLKDSDNIIHAITMIEPIVQNPQANAYERARFLAFLVHFVGDIHQPLHAVSRISKQYPYGDQGGNLFLVKTPIMGDDLVPLHAVWDQGCTLFSLKQKEAIRALSKKIETDYPETAFGEAIDDANINDWAKESFELSKKFVYKTKQSKLLSAEYLAQGEKISEQRAALAGYRLAKVLNGLLKA